MMQVVNTYHIYPDLDDLGAAFLTVLTHSSGDNSFAVYSGVVALRVSSAPVPQTRGVSRMKPKLEHDLPLKDDRKEKVLANTISFDPRVGDTIVINVDGSTLIIRRKA